MKIKRSVLGFVAPPCEHEIPRGARGFCGIAVQMTRMAGNYSAFVRAISEIRGQEFCALKIAVSMSDLNGYQPIACKQASTR
ncbi:MAG: hypothetical protein HY736_24595 [Verrucomicrobia bacterium]|nr:hypothetical protein [Verrucomicrobiota bacterium]